MSNIIKSSAFSAAISRIGNTPATVDSMVRFAAFHGATGQLTPANRLTDALNAGGMTRGDIGKAAALMLADALHTFATVNGAGAFKARKGAEWLGTDASETAALALKGIGERMGEFTQSRTDAKAKSAAAKAAKGTDTGAADTGTAPVLSPLAAALQALGTLTEAAAASRKGETNATGAVATPFALAADALACELMKAPGMADLMSAALRMVPELQAAAAAAAAAAAEVAAAMAAAAAAATVAEVAAAAQAAKDEAAATVQAAKDEAAATVQAAKARKGSKASQAAALQAA